jgi:hypothetical protein
MDQCQCEWLLIDLISKISLMQRYPVNLNNEDGKKCLILNL